MSNKKQVTKKVEKKKINKGIFIGVGIVAILIVVFLIVKGGTSGSSAASGGDLKIPKSEVSENVKFYPYKVGNTNMEVMAVKASDGSIRTAFNTCQVCYDSGKGYYKQEGGTVVCQNCGNRFKLDQIEQVKGGCNPVPILKENKTDDGTNIVISKDFLAQNTNLFGNWKKR